MCFCAHASFAASAGLIAVGTATVLWRSEPAERFVTAMPVIFGIQQAIEGLLWVQLEKPHPDPAVVQGLTTAFLCFALFWWPAYTTFAAWWAEPHPTRRRVLAGMTLLGLFVGTGFLRSHLMDPRPATIVNASISHDLARPGVELYAWLYLPVVLMVGVVSSQPRLKRVHLLFSFAAVVAVVWYEATFTSVWCFFAAVISGAFWFKPTPRDVAPQPVTP